MGSCGPNHQQALHTLTKEWMNLLEESGEQRGEISLGSHSTDQHCGENRNYSLHRDSDTSTRPLREREGLDWASLLDFGAGLSSIEGTG